MPNTLPIPPVNRPSHMPEALRHATAFTPTLWPDIDVYFKRDLNLALRMIDALHEMGVRVVKTAALHDPDCCLPRGGDVQYYVPGRGQVTEPYRAVIERHVLPLPDLRRLCAYVRQRGLDLVLSVYDPVGIALAQEFDAIAIKIPSSNIVHAPLIREAAACARRLVLDTGRSTQTEIDRAVSWAQQAGARDLLIQHSPPGPPAPARDHHLSMMPALALRYGVSCGLSDHFAGLDMLPLAVALGAQVIEKGVCPDGARADIDLAHAMPLSQVPEALRLIQQANDCLGSPDLNHREGRSRAPDRMGLVAARQLHTGECVDRSNVRFAFPTVGLPVETWDEVVGRTLVQNVAPNEPLQLYHLAPP